MLPLSVNAVGAASLVVQVPWKPSDAFAAPECRCRRTALAGKFQSMARARLARKRPTGPAALAVILGKFSAVASEMGEAGHSGREPSASPARRALAGGPQRART